MKRWILGILAAVSLVLMLGVLAVWADALGVYRNVRFERTHDVEGSRPTWECFDVSVMGGLTQVGRMRMSNSPNGSLPPGWNVSSDSGPSGADLLVKGPLGFGYFDKTWSASPRIERRTTAVCVPLWAVALVFALGPALWTRGVLRRRRRASRGKRGLCLACGYDLRASSGACPECGLAQQTRA